MVNVFPAVAYHFCLALPAAFTQPGAHFLPKPCMLTAFDIDEISFQSPPSLHTTSVSITSGVGAPPPQPRAAKVMVTSLINCHYLISFKHVHISLPPSPSWTCSATRAPGRTSQVTSRLPRPTRMNSPPRAETVSEVSFEKGLLQCYYRWLSFVNICSVITYRLGCYRLFE